MDKKEEVLKNIENLKNEIEEEKKKHDEKMKIIEKEKNEELEAIKIINVEKIKKLEEMHAKMSSEWETQLREVKDFGEKQDIQLKKDKKNKLEEDKNKIRNERSDSKIIKKDTKEIKNENDNLESDINKEKEEIQKLMNENQQLLFEARQNQNEINFYEMNFGQLFFSEELKNQIQAETAKYKDEYDKMLKEKLELFNQYRNDQELLNFLSLAQNNPIMYPYLNPHIYNEVYGQPILINNNM